MAVDLYAGKDQTDWLDYSSNHAVHLILDFTKEKERKIYLSLLKAGVKILMSEHED